jgi:hypothetical protein
VPSVLAIEPCPERAAALRAVADDHVPDALMLVDSVDQAFAAMERRVPEVILISPLLPPADEAELIARLRVLPRALHVQTLITPELTAPDEPKPRRLFPSKRDRRPEPDPQAFVKELKTYVGAVRAERVHSTDVHFPGMERRAAPRRVEETAPAILVNGARVQVLDRSETGAQIVSSSLLVPGRFVDVEVDDGRTIRKSRAAIAWGTFESLPSSRVLCRAGLRFTEGDESVPVFVSAAPDQKTANLALIKRPSTIAVERAPRLGAHDLTSLSTVRLPGGSEASLLNLSATGMLFETSSKFPPGYTGQVRLCLADDDVIVPARFVRSEVVTVSTAGVRYRSAVAFEKPIELEDLHATPVHLDRSPKAIADWLREMSTELYRGGDAAALRKHMRDNLTRLLSARDVEIRREPVAPPEGCDSIYFTIVNDESRRAVLQVTFDPGQAPTAQDFRILRAASALASVLFQVN